VSLAPATARAHLASRCCGFEQRPEGGSESLHEVAGQGVERRVARVEGRGESSFGGEEPSVPVEPFREGVSGFVRRGQRRGRVGAGVHLPLEHGFDQVRALREVPVQRSDPDAGQVGDLLGGALLAGRIVVADEVELRRIENAIREAAGARVLPTC
jgi:hypothetical protein